jgi:hypothetical protein
MHPHFDYLSNYFLGSSGKNFQPTHFVPQRDLSIVRYDRIKISDGMLGQKAVHRQHGGTPCEQQLIACRSFSVEYQHQKLRASILGLWAYYDRTVDTLNDVIYSLHITRKGLGLRVPSSPFSLGIASAINDLFYKISPK